MVDEMERPDRRARAGEQLRIEGADMTPKVSCVVVAKKGHYGIRLDWRAAVNTS